MTSLIILHGRQSGLDSRMQVDKRKIEVYDYRSEKPLLKVKPKDYGVKELWFIEDIREDIPIWKQSNRPIIVSGHFNAGYFKYSCCGHLESDPQYVALRTTESALERVAEELTDKGARNIIIGREVDKRKTLDYITQLRDDETNRRVHDFFNFSQEEQERVLHNLFSYGMNHMIGGRLE